MDTNAGKVSDYSAFAQLVELNNSERINDLKNAAVQDLRAHWLQLLRERPYSVDDLFIYNVPPHLQPLRTYLFAQQLVAKVLDGVEGIISRTDGLTVYYGLASMVKAVPPNK